MSALSSTASMTGPQKVAVLILAMSQEEGSALMGMLSEQEIKDVSSAMAQLGAVRAETVDALCREFITTVGSQGALIGSLDSTERLLSASLPIDRVRQIMEEISGPAGRTMWDKLGNVNETLLTNYLKNEYPQTVALVLSKLKPDHAARVLAAMPFEAVPEIIRRMLTIETVHKDVLDGIEHVLRSEFMVSSVHTTTTDPHQFMADIFNNLDRQTESKFMTALDDRDQGAAEKIRSLMFTFEDLAKLMPSAIQAILRDAEKDKLPIALKGTTEAVREAFFKNLSERAGKMLREDIAALGPIRLRDVEEAQIGMVNLAKELAANGQIEIGQGSAEEMVV
jgi:flagellar motor switch protein FliG